MKISGLTTYRVAPRWVFLKIEADEGIAPDWHDPVRRQLDGSVAEW